MLQQVSVPSLSGALFARRGDARMTDSQGLLDKLTGNMFGGETAPDATPTPTPPPNGTSARPSAAEFVPPASNDRPSRSGDSTTSEDDLPELTLAQTVELVAPT